MLLVVTHVCSCLMLAQGWTAKGSANRTEVDHGRKPCEGSEDVESFPGAFQGLKGLQSS